MNIRRCIGSKLIVWMLGIMLMVAAPCAVALIVDSGPLNFPVPQNSNGLYLRLVNGDGLGTQSSWDFNPYLNQGALGFHVSASATLVAAGSSVVALRDGDVVGPAASFLAAGAPASATLLAGGRFLVGLRIIDSASGNARYAYVQITTTAPNGFPATVERFFYEQAGAAITVAIDSRVFEANFEPYIRLTDCDAASVQQALNTAGDGGTVQLPARDCDWGNAHVVHSGAITLRGAGRDSTIIRRTIPVTTPADFLLELDCTGGKRVALSDMSFIGNDDLQDAAQRKADLDSGVMLSHGCVDFRVRNMQFSKFSDAGLTVRGAAQRGVIFRSDFLSNYKCGTDPDYKCLGYGITVYGDYDWPTGDLGTIDAVFAEDSYFFGNRHHIASNYGSRYVARRNTFVANQTSRNFGQADAHGSDGTHSGSRSWEIYSNVVMTSPRSMVADGIVMRGGDGVIYDNTLLKIPYVARLSNESCSGTHPLPYQTTAAYIWGNRFTPIAGYLARPHLDRSRMRPISSGRTRLFSFRKAGLSGLSVSAPEALTQQGRAFEPPAAPWWLTRHRLVEHVFGIKKRRFVRPASRYCAGKPRVLRPWKRPLPLLPRRDCRALQRCDYDAPSEEGAAAPRPLSGPILTNKQSNQDDDRKRHTQ